MKAFVSAVVAIALFSGVAWGVLGQLEMDSETVNQSSTGNVRLD